MANPIRIYDDTRSLHAIGDYIMNYQPYQNAFVNALVNRISMTLVTSRLWDNPWAVFKQGYMEFGETVEEVFVNIAKPHSYDPQKAESKIFEREIPDVRSAFHTMNFQKFYKVTIQNDQLRQAFLSWSGITDLIARVVDSLYTGMNYDEYVVMKYMLAREILSGQMEPQTVAAASDAAGLKANAAALRAASTALTFLKTDYNRAGVYNATERNRQYLIVDANFEANMDVEVMAAAFHMEKAEFLGHLIVIDSWTEHDAARLAELFANDSTYTAFTDGEITNLGLINGLIVDRDWWMVFDNFQNMTENYNGEGLYWNYWLHVWKTFSCSPFANAIVFVTSAGTPTGVTVSPATATVLPGTSAKFSATVAGSGIFDKSVKWSVAQTSGTTKPKAGTTIDPWTGVLNVASDETLESLTVTATSVAKNSVTGTATVATVSGD